MQLTASIYKPTIVGPNQRDILVFGGHSESNNILHNNGKRMHIYDNILTVTI